jgi:3,4-dihydroxy 2-butanone 4-phosphate synthase/GTP cyclohydrolase II
MKNPTLTRALDALRAGQAIALRDDVDGVHGSFLVLAGAKADPEAVNLLATHALGVLCVALSEEVSERLQLEDMPGGHGEPLGAFTVSVEARDGVTTGISAADRARTIQVLADPASRPEALVSPGHIFPVRAHAAGVLGKPREAEATVDLMRLAGFEPVGVFAHVLGADGQMVGEDELDALAAQHALVVLPLSALVEHRMEGDVFVRAVGEGILETEHGKARVLVYQNELDGVTHPVFVHGDPVPTEPTLVRIHSQCLTGDVFHSLRCDCGDQLSMALERMGREGTGVLIYLRQEGRGIGLDNKIRAYALQDRGKDTVDANVELGFLPDQRGYVVAAQILRDLGIQKLRLMTNNLRKVREMERYGLEVTERIPAESAPRPENERYLRAKKERLGHLFEL